VIAYCLLPAVIAYCLLPVRVKGNAASRPPPHTAASERPARGQDSLLGTATRNERIQREYDRDELETRTTSPEASPRLESRTQLAETHRPSAHCFEQAMNPLTASKPHPASPAVWNVRNSDGPSTMSDAAPRS